MIRKYAGYANYFLLLFVLSSCQNSDKAQTEKQVTNTDSSTKSFTTVNAEPHQYGGWYCPDNFGFVPVDVQKLNEVPAIAHRLPTKEEIKKCMSLIEVDIMKYPDAKALNMDLPKLASIPSERLGVKELIVVIQAIVVQSDTIVGYRFVNGGNGSSRIKDVSFLSNDEVKAMGSQPFYYSKSVLKASPSDIWRAMSKTNYFKQLGTKFDKQKFFSSELNANAQVELSLSNKQENAVGFVGMVFGNYYLHIDYDRNGVHYSEKLLMIENKDSQTTELFFASGPFPKDFEKQKTDLESWMQDVKKVSEAH